MKTKLIFSLMLLIGFYLIYSCKEDNKDYKSDTANLIDTLKITHSMKGWELYSWPEGETWNYSFLIGTNRLKTLEEVKTTDSNAMHLITVKGIDILKTVLDKFPENEDLFWVGEGWLQSSWGSNYGNIKLPSKAIIEEITQYCKQRKINIQVSG